MKILAYSDLHANFAYPDYMSYLDKTVDFLKTVIQERRPNLVIFLGDLFDTFSMLDVKTGLWGRQAVTEITDAVRAVSGDHVLLSGNHDVADADAKISSLHLADCGNGAMIVTNPVVWKGVLCASFGARPEEVIGILSKGEEKVEVLACHFDWIGGRLTPTYVTEKGWDPQAFARSFPHVVVLDGHYHNPGHMGPVTFVGAPCYRDFKDSEVPGEPRGFVFYDTEADVMERIENPYTYRVATIKVDTLEKFQAVIGSFRGKTDNVKARIYVPGALLAEAEKERERFLWCSITSTDTYRSPVPEGQGIVLTAQPKDVVDAAVAKAPGDLDRARLWGIGIKAFGG